MKEHPQTTRTGTSLYISNPLCSNMSSVSMIMDVCNLSRSDAEQLMHESCNDSERAIDTYLKNASSLEWTVAEKPKKMSRASFRSVESSVLPTAILEKTSKSSRLPRQMRRRKSSKQNTKSANKKNTVSVSVKAAVERKVQIRREKNVGDDSALPCSVLQAKGEERGKSVGVGSSKNVLNVLDTLTNPALLPTQPRSVCALTGGRLRQEGIQQGNEKKKSDGCSQVIQALPVAAIDTESGPRNENFTLCNATQAGNTGREASSSSSEKPSTISIQNSNPALLGISFGKFYLTSDGFEEISDTTLEVSEDIVSLSTPTSGHSEGAHDCTAPVSMRGLFAKMFPDYAATGRIDAGNSEQGASATPCVSDKNGSNRLRKEEISEDRELKVCTPPAVIQPVQKECEKMPMYISKGFTSQTRTSVISFTALRQPATLGTENNSHQMSQPINGAQMQRPCGPIPLQTLYDHPSVIEGSFAPQPPCSSGTFGSNGYNTHVLGRPVAEEWYAAYYHAWWMSQRYHSQVDAHQSLHCGAPAQVAGCENTRTRYESAYNLSSSRENKSPRKPNGSYGNGPLFMGPTLECPYPHFKAA